MKPPSVFCGACWARSDAWAIIPFPMQTIKALSHEWGCGVCGIECMLLHRVKNKCWRELIRDWLSGHDCGHRDLHGEAAVFILFFIFVPINRCSTIIGSVFEHGQNCAPFRYRINWSELNVFDAHGLLYLNQCSGHEPKFCRLDRVNDEFFVELEVLTKIAYH